METDLSVSAMAAVRKPSLPKSLRGPSITTMRRASQSPCDNLWTLYDKNTLAGLDPIAQLSFGKGTEHFDSGMR